MAALALLQPDVRASARLTEALGDVHELVTHRTWDELSAGLTEGSLEGCVVDADHPVRAEAEKRIAELRAKHPGLAIIVHVDQKRRVGFFDLGELGVDGLVTSEEGRTGLRSDVGQALSVSRSRRVARALRERRVAEPGPEALAWAVVNATDQPGVKRLATVLGLTKGGLRDALLRADLPAAARILLWGRLLSAGARLANDQQSVEEVAFSLGYATSTSLARAMKTHTGYTPRQISAGGGLDLVLDALLPRSEPTAGTARGASTTILGILGLLVSTGCATLGMGSAAVDRRAVDTILESPGIDRMQVGVLAVDASSGRVLYEHDAEKKFIPASNQKILVAAAEDLRYTSGATGGAFAIDEGELEVVVKWREGEDIGRGCLAGMLEECGRADRLVAIESPPLSEILAEVLGPSQNWMTEQLLLSLAAAYGETGSWAEGVAVVEAFLFEHVGVDTMSVSARDGSGLSAYNLVTPEALVRVLRHMHDGAFAAEFRSAMAEPGEAGSTLERRLHGMDGRVFAKTGTISNVNSLSGYLVRENGQDVIFSILTNGSGLPASYVRSAIDDILTAIAR